MTAPEPRANPLLLGHAAALTSLAEALRSRRMHHAWLITGHAGIGKATLAFRVARAVLAGPVGEDLATAPDHPVFRRVAAGTHADLLTLECSWNEKTKKQRTEIIVDEARGVADFLRLTAAESGWRVVVVDGAERLNRQAANALLKILEEPPPRALLLLTCAAPGRLPPTIRSRCRLLRLDPLGEADMDALLLRYLPELDETARLRLAALAEGSPGRALRLADGDGLPIAAMVDAVLESVPDLPPGRAHEVADTIGRSDAAFAAFMDLLRAGIAAAVRDAARGRADPGQARLVSALPLAAWGDVWHALGRLQDETEHLNLDKRQAIVSGLALLGRPG